MRLPSFRCLLACLIALGIIVVAPARADTIAMIGTGNVGGTLGPLFAGLGHTIVYGSREPQRADVQALVNKTGHGASATLPAQAAADADLVMLAVPGNVVREVAAELGDLSGKIVIDPTNPTRAGTDGLRVHAVETSNAQILQEMLPGARVVKAFNTMNFRTMMDPASTGGPVSMPMAGNDAAAKARVAALAEGLGLQPVDVGPVRYAHELEGMLVIWINARIMGHPYVYYLRPLPSR